MDPLIKELEAQLAQLSPAERAEVVQGLRHVIAGGRAITARLKLSKLALVRFLASVGMAVSQDRTLTEILAKAHRRSKEFGTHAAALFSAV